MSHLASMPIWCRVSPRGTMTQEAVWMVGRFELPRDGYAEFQWIHGTVYSVLPTFDLRVLPTGVPVRIVAIELATAETPVVQVLHFETLNDVD